MSTLAMQAFHRLRIDRKYRLDGTARLVLYHLCWRHQERLDAAEPSTNEMAADLGINRSCVTSAIGRLEAAWLIRREQGGGRGRATRYRLAFLGAHRVDPDSTQPIDWQYRPSKVSGPPDSLGPESVRPTGQFFPETVRRNARNCPAKRSKLSGPPDTIKRKSKKGAPARAQERAAAPRTADDVFRAAFAQRDLALLSVTDGEGRSPVDEEDDDQLQAGAL